MVLKSMHDATQMKIIGSTQIRISQNTNNLDHTHDKQDKFKSRYSNSNYSEY